MENIMMIGVWVLAFVISFVPMSLTYKVTGITVSIMLIAAVTYMLHRKKLLSKTNLVINLIIIGWDIAIVYSALTAK